MPRLIFALVMVMTLGFVSRPAAALPVFAHRYGFSCQQCHTTVPTLNAYGEAFRRNGFSLPLPTHGAAPVAVKVNLAYSSDPDPSGLPKAIVDEIELLSGGHVGSRGSYFVEQYVVDGGRIGRTRDAWFAWDTQEDHEGLALRAGRFTLPLPVDVESERPTISHYSLYDQSVASGFAFFDPRSGADISYSSERSGLESHLALTDAGTFATLSKRIAEDTRLSAYRYFSAGSYRQGLTLEREEERFDFLAALQSGFDGTQRSSGGFLQASYSVTSALSFVTRYEGTSSGDAGQDRALLFDIVTRPRRNMRFTIEGALDHGHTTLNSALLFAY